MNRYYHFYKPAGCVSACRDAEHQTVLDFFPPEERPGLFPLGRLDRNTEGLLIITDDGKLNHRLLDPENHVEKQYLFWAAGELGTGELEQLRQGVHLKGLHRGFPAAGGLRGAWAGRDLKAGRVSPADGIGIESVRCI